MEPKYLKLFLFVCVVSTLAAVSESRSERIFPKGVSFPVDVNDAHVQKLAELSLSTMEHASNYREKLGLVRVVKAYKQELNGILYNLTLEVGSRCKSQFCNVTIHEQIWYSSVPSITAFHCGNKTSSRIQPDPMTSAHYPVDINDKNVQKLAKLSLPKLENLSGRKEKLKLERVIEAYEQVVGKSVYYLTLKVSNSEDNLKICKVKVHEKPGIFPEPEVTDADCGKWKQVSYPVDINDKNVQKLAKLSMSTLKRLSGRYESLNLDRVLEAYEQVSGASEYNLTLIVSNSKGRKICSVGVFDKPGFFSEPEVKRAYCESRKQVSYPVDVNDKNVQKLAKFSMSTLKKSSGRSESLQLDRVVEAYEQVVGESVYNIILIVSQSKDEKKICNVRVLDKKGSFSKPEVTGYYCESRKQDPDACYSVDVDDEDVRKLAKFSVSALEKRRFEILTFDRVVEAYEQVFGGPLYVLTLKVSNTFKGPKICNVRVLDKPGFFSSPEVIESSCED